MSVISQSRASSHASSPVAMDAQCMPSSSPLSASSPRSLPSPMMHHTSPGVTNGHSPVSAPWTNQDAPLNLCKPKTEPKMQHHHSIEEMTAMSLIQPKREPVATPPPPAHSNHSRRPSVSSKPASPLQRDNFNLLGLQNPFGIHPQFLANPYLALPNHLQTAAALGMNNSQAASLHIKATESQKVSSLVYVTISIISLYRNNVELRITKELSTI